MSNHWIQTRSGIRFDLLEPTVDMVDILDIAHALSNICRYTGHVRFPYSVAQHSVLVSDQLPPELRLQGLLHDATEAYVGDVATPLKRLLPDYERIEARIWGVIAARFRLPVELDPRVKLADATLLQAERAVLLDKSPEPWDADRRTDIPPMKGRVERWSYDRARMEFIDAFYTIGDDRK